MTTVGQGRRQRMERWKLRAFWTWQSVLVLWRQPEERRRIRRWVRELRANPLELRSPWWSYQMVEVVGALLEPGMRAFEFGSGGSTLWLVDRGLEVTSVEDQPFWGEAVRNATEGKMTLLLEPDGGPSYVATIGDVPEHSLDLVIIDGVARLECAQAARTKVRPGRWVLFDDSQRVEYAACSEIFSGWPARTITGLKPGGGGGVGTSTLFQCPPSTD